MKDADRPGYEIRGYIETPVGSRTTPQRQEDVADIMASALGLAKDKVDGGEAAIRVDRVVSDGTRLTRVRGVRHQLDE